MITAVVTSDNHLGVYYARLRPDRLEERRRALQRAFERVVDAALERRVDLFLHAGDLFDRPDPRNAERLFVARQMRRLREAGIPSFAITGNHDSPRSYGYDGGVAPQEEMAALDAFHLFRDARRLQSQTLEIRGQRVCIWGMSSDFNRPHDECALSEVVEAHQRGGDIDIVLLHYGVEGWTRADAQEPTITLANLDKIPADAFCVGHLHERQQGRLPGGAVLLNPGSTEHINFGEENLECGYWLLHMEPRQVEAEYVSLPTQLMRTLKLDLTDWPSPPDPLSHAAGEGELDAESEDIILSDSETPGSSTTDIDSPLSLVQGEGPGVRAAAATHPSSLLSHPLTAIEEVSAPDQLLRVRLSGRVPREQFHALDLVALQVRGNELNFSCQLDTEGLIVYDQTDDLTIGYGVSFDAGEELAHQTRLLMINYADAAAEQELCQIAGQQISALYERLTRGAR